ncbi:MAG: HIRAN domain-containing protein [Xanthomonadales bacterium]|nr:HIRAN domain-containing protein [Xanthomonadales bacterium]
MSDLPDPRYRRRDWLRNVASATIATLANRAGPTEAAPGPGPVELLECAIAGFQYHAGAILWTEMRVGDPLQLEREPDNPHDPLATALLWRGRRIGYIPRVANRALARRLDAGLATTASITALHQFAPPWERVEVLVQALV